MAPFKSSRPKISPLFVWLQECGYSNDFLQLFLNMTYQRLTFAKRQPLTYLSIRQLGMIYVLLHGYKDREDIAKVLQVHNTEYTFTTWQQMALDFIALYEPANEMEARAFLINMKQRKKRIAGKSKRKDPGGGPELVGQFMTAIEKGEADALDIEEFRKIISGKLSGQQDKDKPKDTGNGTSVKL